MLYLIKILYLHKGILIFRTDDKEKAISVIRDNGLRSIDESVAT